MPNPHLYQLNFVYNGRKEITDKELYNVFFKWLKSNKITYKDPIFTVDEKYMLSPEVTFDEQKNILRVDRFEPGEGYDRKIDFYKVKYDKDFYFKKMIAKHTTVEYRGGTIKTVDYE